MAMVTDEHGRNTRYPRGFARTLGGFLPVKSVVFAGALSLLVGVVIAILLTYMQEPGSLPGRVVVALVMVAGGYIACRRLIRLNRAGAELQGLEQSLGWIFIAGVLSTLGLRFASSLPVAGWLGLSGFALSFGYVVAAAASGIEDRRARQADGPDGARRP